MTSSSMDKTETKKQSDKDTLAEVTKEMAKPRVAMSARERDADENRDSGRVTDDPMKLLRQKVDEELAAPSQASTGMSLTPNVNTCLKTLGRPRIFVSESRIDALRASGASWRAVAKELGVGMGTARRASQARAKNLCAGFGTGSGEGDYAL